MWCGQSVRSGLSVRKIYRVVFLVLLCVITAGLWTFSQARANGVLASGTSGTCTWTYAMVGGVKTLTIKPTNGSEGRLDAFGWHYAEGPTEVTWGEEKTKRHSADTKRVVVEGTVKVGPSAKGMFANFFQATDMDLRGLDVSEVTDMEVMFRYCCALTTLNGPVNWNVAKVKNMNNMFYACNALTSLDVSKWNVGNVEGMIGMFQYCKALTSLDVKDWNVSKVTGMSYMFRECEALTSLPVGNWDVSKVADMGHMFKECSSLTTLDVSKWNVSSLNCTTEMFNGCSALTSLDLGSWVMPSVTWPVVNTTHHTGRGGRGGRPGRPMICETFVPHRQDMFGRTGNLATIYLGTGTNDCYEARGYASGCYSPGGRPRSLTESPNFEDVGASVGTAWQQINLAAGGTEASPKGKIFANAEELAAFHKDRSKRSTDREGYVRVVPANLKINFLKGDPAVQGEMQSQEYRPGETKPLSPCSFTWAGYKFIGWKGSDNKEYADKASYTHPAGSYKRVTQPGEVPPEILNLTAQWEEAVVLTFQAKPNGNLNFAEKKVTIRPQGENPSDFLLPPDATQNIGAGQGVKWTAVQNGNSTSWSYLATGSEKGKLSKEEIEKAAKQGNKFVDTTFQAEVASFVTLTYQAKDTGVTLDRTSEEVASGTKPLGSSVTSTIPSNKRAKWTVKTGNARANWYFVGATLTPDKIMASLETGQSLSDMTFEVELVGFATLTYKTDDPGITLNPPSEEIIPGEDPKGTTITSTIPPGKVAKWTIPSRPGWSFTGKTLTPDVIKSVQVGGGDLTDMTFEVKLVDDETGFVTLTYQAKDTGVTLNRTSEKVAPGANPKGCRVTSTIPVDKKAKWTVKTGNARANWFSVGATLTPEKIKEALAPSSELSDMTFEVELVGFSTLTYKTDDPGITLNPPSEEVIPGEDPKGTTITSTIPPGKVAKWTIPSRPGWSFTGKTLTPDAIKSAQVGGGDLTDMTFEVKLVDEGGTDDKNGKGGTDDKGGKGGTDDKNGKGGTDGKGGKPDGGKPGDQKPGDKLKKGNTTKTSKSRSKKIPGTSDITSQTLSDAQALLPAAGIAASIAGIAIATLRRREKSGQ